MFIVLFFFPHRQSKKKKKTTILDRKQTKANAILENFKGGDLTGIMAYKPHTVQKKQLQMKNDFLFANDCTGSAAILE